MSRPPIPTARLMLRLIRNQPWLYLANAIGWTVIWCLAFVPALAVRTFFDAISGQEAASFSVRTLVVIMLAYGAGYIVIMWLAMWNDAHFMFRVGAQLRRNMLGRIFEMPGAQALDQSPGEAISRFREDVDEVEETLSWTVDILGILLFAAAALALLVSIDARVTLFVFAPTIVVIWLAAQARQRVRRYREAAREATGRITDALGETFSSVQSIKVSGAEASMVNHFRGLNDARRIAMVRDAVLTAVLESLFWNTVNIGTAVILVVAAQSMSAGTFTVGDFALFVYFLGSFSEGVFVLGLFVGRYQQATVSFGRMAVLLRGAPARRLASPVDLGLKEAATMQELSLADVEPLEELRVEELTYVYPNTDAGIHQVDLVVPRASFTVVTGRIGSGKTTLLRAVLGLLPAREGVIRWNGRVVEHPAEFFVPPRSAYTPQVPRLFSLSLRDNLLLGRGDTDSRLHEAIRAAVLDPDIESMPAGLGTMVGPLGVRLSGGQVQRSAAARMFVRQPELLVFDDLSSALDVETERLLWQRLFAEQPKATCLVVSHRRPALQQADQIVLLEGGRVSGTGTLEELLEENAEFRRLWEREANGG
jgi:ATP-binding cassette subfamily B protein